MQTENAQSMMPTVVKTGIRNPFHKTSTLAIETFKVYIHTAGKGVFERLK